MQQYTQKGYELSQVRPFVFQLVMQSGVVPTPGPVPQFVQAPMVLWQLAFIPPCNKASVLAQLRAIVGARQGMVRGVRVAKSPSHPGVFGRIDRAAATWTTAR